MKTHQVLTLIIALAAMLFIVSCGDTTEEKEAAFVIDEKTLLESARGNGDVGGSGLSGNNAQNNDDEEEIEVPAGMLTAGEWSDLDGWSFWRALMQRQSSSEYQDYWKIYPQNRYSVVIKDKNQQPVNNCVVRLKNKGKKTIWAAKTDNTGQAELWASLFDKKPVNHNDFFIEVEYNGKTQRIKDLQPYAKPSDAHVHILETQEAAPTSNAADVFLVVDATGSMGDEIKFLKAEIQDVVKTVKEQNQGISFQLGALFYRDLDDEYLTRTASLSQDVNKTFSFMKMQGADGGGDYPEAVSTALSETIMQQPWREDATTRIAFVVLDAPPHYNEEVLDRLHKIAETASAKGIKIIPIAASGIDKDTEFLMRFFALATNGTYTFLTDHSGIGEAHAEPTVGPYEVEHLNKLLIRVINENLQQPMLQ